MKLIEDCASIPLPFFLTIMTFDRNDLRRSLEDDESALTFQLLLIIFLISNKKL